MLAVAFLAPLVQGLLTGAATGGAMALGNYLSNNAQALTEPVKYAAQRAGWYALPWLLPDPTALFDVWRRGMVSGEEHIMTMIRAHGIDFDPENPLGKLWRTIYKASRPMPSIEVIIEAYTRGILTQEAFIKLLIERGGDFQDYFAALELSAEVLDPIEARTAWKRGFLKENELDRLLRRNKIVDPKIQRIIKESANILPGPQDLISMVVREAFNPEQVRLLDLDAEYDENADFQFWAEAQGLGKAKAITPEGEEKTLDVPRMIWRSHWQLPSPTQAYQFLQRLRPDRIDYYREAVGPDLARELNPFTAADLSSLLKAGDYAKKWRPMLAAISYLPLTRVDTRRLYETGLFSGDEVVAELQDQGYSRRQADKMLQWFKFERERDEIEAVRQTSKAEVLEAYAVGTLSPEAAAMALYPIMQRRLDKLREWNELGPAQQQVVASNYIGVRSALYSVDLRIYNRQIKLQLATLQGRLLGGIISLAEAAFELEKLTLEEKRKQEILFRWERLLEGPRRTLNLMQLRRLADSKVIALEEYARRLANLGYRPDDIVPLVQASSQKMDQTKGKGEKQEQGGKAPIGEIKKWYGEGLWNSEEVTRVLEARGWNDREIQTFLLAYGPEE